MTKMTTALFITAVTLTAGISNIASAKETKVPPTTVVYAGDASSSLTDPDPAHQPKDSAETVHVTLGAEVHAGDASSSLNQPIHDDATPYHDNPNRTEIVPGDSGR